MPEPDRPLPKAPILGYFSDISTPTRVRIIGARAVFWIGMLHFAFSFCILVLFAWDIWTTACDFAARRGWRGWRPGAPLPSSSVTLRDLLDALSAGGNNLYLIVFVSTFAPSILLTVLSIFIRRGRRVPTLLTLYYFAPLTLLLWLLTGLGAGLILVIGLATYDDEPGLALLRWLLLLPLPILIILLLKDLCSFLKWIARQPAADKPPTPFLPPSLRSAHDHK